MESVKNFFRGKSWGFYVAFAGAVLLLVTAVVYSVTFSISEHINLNFEASVLVLSLIGAVAFAGLSVFDATKKFAAPVLFLFGFIGFLLFEQTSYIYLSAVFFEASTAADIAMSFASMEFGYAFCTVAYIAVWVLSTIGIFTSTDRKKEKINETV